MVDQIPDRAGGINDTTLGFTPLSAVIIAAFSIIHFVVGYGLSCLWMYSSWYPAATLGRILVNIWWFPVQQLWHLPQLQPPNRFVLALPMIISWLWGVVAFVIWKASKGQYLRFSLRTLLIAATLVAAILGLVA